MLIGLPGLVQTRALLYIFLMSASSIPTHFWSLRFDQQAQLAHTLFIDVSGVSDGAVGAPVWCRVQGVGAVVVFVRASCVGGSVHVLLLLRFFLCRCTCRAYRVQSDGVAWCGALCAV